ncbi:dolichyl-diphosphooligosaccharide-protein glycotransferase [Cavenderia fasciculata]|uniref:Dolichyl-diphosphooligosaccharide--protein glycosyltransferase subunit 1 n=1 Tax=Cavenderia fasciculata TaxID=261658 RepID=F4QAP9_CACFS|nr:dolichyl-diphosphooligosaccharide-protein glycotransferase [Cavenderia fasciculata]EGG15768.1 dolichyl-diphosphooligosaccharide-protein glycotransferase [Cavenderia fasciculata]|eukprot:XP_004354515.1 dolichyl-diphosphooligosaccharide-protein glycotransferase [Cavenderia fasciculata]
MRIQLFVTLLISVIALLLCTSSSAAASSNIVKTNWINNDVTRTIDLSTQIAKQTIQIKAKNQGTQSTNIYTVAIPTFVDGHQQIQAFIGDSEKKSLNILQSYTTKSNENQEFNLYDIELDKSYSKDSTLILKVKIISMNQVVAYPPTISQGQNQLVRFTDNAYFTSPYETESQKSTFKLSSSKVESYTQSVIDGQTATQKGQQVVYGPFRNVAPLAFSSVTVHYENNQPFLRLTNLIKEYEVSHWGNIAVETFYWILHGGAKWTGSFSRLDFQRNPAGSAPSHITEITEIVPRESADFYYRDEIGNISSSQYYPKQTETAFKIQPRFPLVGGWKNEFYTGYNLPTAPFLQKDTDTGRFQLTVGAGVSIENIFVQDHTLRFILPEGATDIKVVRTPFGGASKVEESFDIRKTFFDTVGRPVFEIKTEYTSFENYEPIVISYNLSPLAIFHEPLLAIGAVFCLCLFVIVFTRIDLSLLKRSSNKVARTPEVEKNAQQFKQLFDGRVQYHQDMEDAINTFARTGTAQEFQVAKQTLEQKYKESLSSTANKIVSTVSALDPVFSTHLKDLLEKSTQLQQIQSQIADHEAKQRSNKDQSSKSVSRFQYEEIRNKLISTYRKTFDDIITTFESLY